MRNPPALTTLAALLLLSRPGPLAHGGDPAPPEPVSIAVPAEIGQAVLDGDSLYALAGDKGLLRIDLGKHRTSPVVRFPEGQTLRLLSVSGGRAGVTVRDEKGGMHLHVIDLVAGRITRTLDQADSATREIGFISDDLLYTVGGRSVSTVEIATGKTRHAVEVKGGVLAACHRVGDRLYVAREYAGGLAVIDLKGGKLLDLIPTRDWLFQVQVVGDSAFVWGSFDGIGRIDLKTREYETLKQPEADNAHHRYTILAGPGERLLVLSQKAVYEYDGSGRQVGTTPLPATAPRTLAGVWDGRAVLVGKDAVSLVELATTARPR